MTLILALALAQPLALALALALVPNPNPNPSQVSRRENATTGTAIAEALRAAGTLQGRDDPYA